MHSEGVPDLGLENYPSMAHLLEQPAWKIDMRIQCFCVRNRLDVRFAFSDDVALAQGLTKYSCSINVC